MTLDFGLVNLSLVPKDRTESEKSEAHPRSPPGGDKSGSETQVFQLLLSLALAALEFTL